MRHQAVISLVRNKPVQDIQNPGLIEDMLKSIRRSIDSLERSKDKEDLRAQLKEKRSVRHLEPQVVEERRVRIEEHAEEERRIRIEDRDDEVRRVRVVDEEDVRN